MLQRIQADAAYKSEWNEGLEHGDKMLQLVSDGLQKAHELKDKKLDPATLQKIEQKYVNLMAIYTEMERLIRSLSPS